MENNKKCCFVSIVGAPNSGKSTLLNIVLGYKISIVTPKEQTTRSNIRGIFTDHNLQVVFIDTPGIFKATKKLEKSIVKTAYQGLSSGIDFCFHLIDATKGLTKNDYNIIDLIKNKSVTKLVAVINKIDAVKAACVQNIIDKLTAIGVHKDIISMSALNNIGIREMITYLDQYSPVSPWFYDDDQITDINIKFLSSEITREKLFLLLDKELPYNLSVETENWKENDKEVRINQVIFVTKDNHKKIILGDKGAMIKRVGIQARKDLEKFLDKKVHLYLFVKVRENWMDDPHIYKYMGMVQDKS